MYSAMAPCDWKALHAECVARLAGTTDPAVCTRLRDTAELYAFMAELEDRKRTTAVVAAEREDEHPLAVLFRAVLALIPGF